MQHTMTRQRGQSMSEFLIAMIVLFPLYLAIDYAGKYGDLTQTAVQASRYAAMQRVLEPNSGVLPDTVIEDQVRARFFLDGGRNSGKLRSDDSASAVPDSAGQPVLWKDLAGNALLTSPSQVSVLFEKAPTAPPPSVGWAVNGMAWTANKTYTEGQTAKVELTLKNKLDLGTESAPDFKIGAATAALAGGWGSEGSHMTREAAARIVPSSLIPEFATSFIDFVIGFFEPYGPEFGCIKADIVPGDRLDPYVGGQGCTP